MFGIEVGFAFRKSFSSTFSSCYSEVALIIDDLNCCQTSKDSTAVAQATVVDILKLPNELFQGGWKTDSVLNNFSESLTSYCQTELTSTFGLLNQFCSVLCCLILSSGPISCWDKSFLGCPNEPQFSLILDCSIRAFCGDTDLLARYKLS